MMKDKMFNFEDLRLYQKSLDFIDLIHSNALGFPKEVEDFNSDLRRASRKIALHIAEGSGENKVLFIKSLRDAKSCVRECLVYVTIAYRRNYITAEQENDLRERLIELAKMLGGLISSLQNRLKNNRNSSDPNQYYDTNDNENIQDSDI